MRLAELGFGSGGSNSGWSNLEGSKADTIQGRREPRLPPPRLGSGKPRLPPPRLGSPAIPLLFSPGKARLFRSTGGALRALDWGPGGGPDLIVDDGGDATLLIHEGFKAEELFEKTGQVPDPASTDNAEFQLVLTIIRDNLKVNPKRFTKMKERLVGVSEKPPLE